MVRRGLVIACRLAGSPTKRSPLSVKATTLGVRRLPSWLGMTLTSPPSITATTELVVPRSMPMIFSVATVDAPLSRQGRPPVRDASDRQPGPAASDRKEQPYTFDVI